MKNNKNEQMKKTVAIIMGGYSSEYNISLKSGNVVYQHISKELYNVYRVHILPEKWVALDENSKEYPINKHDFSFTKNKTKITFDVVFNAIHGHPGEDGTILAYFDLLNIPHTSAPFYQMAVTFNKRDSLNIVRQGGIKTAPSFVIYKNDTINTKKIIDKTGLPCFVKPNGAGSSFGISKVTDISQLSDAVKKALKEDDTVLIESFLQGTEVTVGIIEYQGKLKVLPITEIVSENDFFDYDAKYNGKSQEITPARISKELQEKVEKIALKTYKLLNMKGFSRTEYIIVDDEPHFLEMNTVPGLTAESILPQQAKCANISLTNLFHNAIEMALNR